MQLILPFHGPQIMTLYYTCVNFYQKASNNSVTDLDEEITLVQTISLRNHDSFDVARNRRGNGALHLHGSSRLVTGLGERDSGNHYLHGTLHT